MNEKNKHSIDKKNLPYFKFYPTDFLLGIAYMTNAEIGSYIKLLCYQWNKGYLPNDMTILEKLSGGMTDNVLDKFIKTDKGWINERLEKERNAYLDRCEKNSNAINSRWNKHDTNVLQTYNERITNVIPSQKSEVRSQNTEVISQKAEVNNKILEIVNYLNSVLKTNYKHNSKETMSLINARFKEGFTVDDFKIVIDKQNEKWKSDSKMCDYLRPKTLFSTKFESYLNAKSQSDKVDEFRNIWSIKEEEEGDIIDV